jgi:formylglycine-generating enzyme required for sulfatase activity
MTSGALETAWAQELEAKRVNSLGMTFVLVPAGTFFMGSPDGEQGRSTREIRHRVEITHPFYLQTTEVTLGQWWKVMGKKLIGRRKGSVSIPVTRVSWYDARDFIERLNASGGERHRLPTEAEWEYACRAGSDSAYSFGEIIDCTRAAYGNNSLGNDTCALFLKTLGISPDMPAPAGSFPPNAWGLHDMHGNVWEWCLDCYVEVLPSGERADPLVSRNVMAKVRRGGSWFGDAQSLRSANRAYAHPSSRFQTTGFRLVLEAASR